jgi:hypothetical protein
MVDYHLDGNVEYLTHVLSKWPTPMMGGALTAPPGREEIHHNLRNFSEGLQAPRRLVSDKSGRMNKFASLTSRVACSIISNGNPSQTYDGSANTYGTATCDGTAGRTGAVREQGYRG